MNRAAPPSIDQLRELPLPVMPTSYWPQTWGWLAVFAALLLIALAVAAWRYLRWRRNRYRREALARLETLAKALNDPARRLPALRELPTLLKRVALSMPAGEVAANLGGPQWQAFLQTHSALPLPEQFAQHLALLAYAPAERVLALAEDEVQALLKVCRQWIEVHHVAA